MGCHVPRGGYARKRAIDLDGRQTEPFHGLNARMVAGILEALLVLAWSGMVHDAWGLAETVWRFATGN